MVAKGIELDRDIYPGEITQVKLGFEQSERIKAAVHSGSLEPMDIVNIKSQGGTIAVQPGSVDPLSDFGRDLPLPKRVIAHQEANKLTDKKPEAWTVPLDSLGEKDLPLPSPAAKQMADKPVEEPVEEDVEEQDVITSQLLKVEEETLVPVQTPKIDEFAEFFRRKGQSRLRYVNEMTDLNAIRQVLVAARGTKSKQALTARIAELSHTPREGEVGI
jgi:hypothetical protein